MEKRKLILAASLALNAVAAGWLLFSREAPAGRSDPGVLDRTRPALPPSEARAARPAALPRLSCEALLAEKREKITQLGKSLRAGRSLIRGYDQGRPNAELQAKVSAHLAAAFVAQGAAPPAVECRDAICSFQSPSGVKLTHASRWTTDEPWVRRHFSQVEIRPANQRVYVRLIDDATPWGPDVLKQLAQGFKNSGQIAACQSRFSQQGVLEASLMLEGAEDRGDDQASVSMTFSGSLAGTPLGDCVAESLRTWLDQHRPSPEVTLAQMQVPLI
jgi:hypothetical protein